MLTVEKLASWCQEPVILSTAPQRLSADPMIDMHKHLLVLWSVARWLPMKLGIEIGVCDGTSTLPLLLAAQQNGGQLVSVDIDPCPAAHENVQSCGLDDSWSFMQQTSVSLAAGFALESVDLVLVDGDHSYEGVCADIDAFAPLVRRGGVMLFHDYFSDFAGVAPAIHRELPKFGFTFTTLPWGYGLTVAVREGAAGTLP